MASLGRQWPQWCTVCNVKLVNSGVASDHYASSKHMERLKQLKTMASYPLRCQLCDKRFSSQTNAKEHFESRWHKSKEAGAKVIDDVIKAYEREQHLGSYTASQGNLFCQYRSTGMLTSSMTSLDYNAPSQNRHHCHHDYHPRSKHLPLRFPNQTNVQASGKADGQIDTHRYHSWQHHRRGRGRGRGRSRHKSDAHFNSSEAKNTDDRASESDSLNDAMSSDEEMSEIENNQEEIRAIVQDILSKRTGGDVSDMSDIIQQVKEILKLKQQKHDSSCSSENKQKNNSTTMEKHTSSPNKREQCEQIKKKLRHHNKEPKDGAVHKEESVLAVAVDEKAVFRILVKRFSGQCEVRDLVSEAQHLFPPGLDVLNWLLTSKSFKVFKRRDSSKLDESVVFVKLDKLRLCLYNADCNRPHCPYIHLCHSFLAGMCTKVNCKFSHRLNDEHNSRVLKELHLSDVFTEEEIFSLLQCCTLFVCSRWNIFGHCSLSKTFCICPYLHVCQDFILGTCINSKCRLGHSFDAPPVKLLLGAAFYNLLKVPTHSLCKAILLPKKELRSETSANQTVELQKRSAALKEDKEDGNFSHEKEFVRGKVNEPQVEENAQKQSDIHIYDDDVDRFICEANLRKQCRYGPRKCTKHHYPLPYVWQIKVDGIWQTTTKNSSIEAAFCDAKIDNYTINEDEGSRMVAKVDFNQMIVTTTLFLVRRLSTESYIEVPERHEYHTTWIWYWCNDIGQWTPYEMDSQPYQDVIEAKFLAKQVACFAEINHQQYLLDFRNMIQINRETGEQRRIKRRPQLVTPEEILLGNRKVTNWVHHFDKTVLPFGWAPMNTLYYTTPDLILLDEQSSDFAMVFNKFFATMDHTKYGIDYIFRIQNLALWEKYIRKKREMQQDAHVKGEINEKHLFHGTSSEEVVHCICKEGFDWRVCGKNGTLYGNGSYFARDASYSNNYSLKHSSGKQQMFLSRVMVGAYTKGKQDLARPPQSFNSCVDVEEDPNIFVVFHDDQSYPEYLIEYKTK